MSEETIRLVLVALDGSARAPRVLAVANDLAARYGAPLALLRVIEIPPEFPPAGAGFAEDRLPAYLAKTASAELAALAKSYDIAAESMLVRKGQPWRAILEAADELDADIIVMGSHGYSGLDHLLGTTAGKVANLAARNVFIVHERGL